VTFVTFTVLTAVDVRYQQDAWEFISRVEHITSPAAVIFAAIGAAWAWRASLPARIASVVLLLWAVRLHDQAQRAWSARLDGRSDSLNEWRGQRRLPIQCPATGLRQ
jgi:hypothetical protein